MVQLSGNYVYYGGGGTDVRRIKKDGSDDVVLAPVISDDNREFTYVWTLTPTALLWANDWVNKAVRGCALPNCPGGPRDFIGTSTYPVAVTYAPANATVYFGDGLNIKAMPWPNGTASDFVVGQERVYRMAADSSFLYWGAPSGAHKQPLAGGAIIDLVKGRGIGEGFAVSPNALFWSESYGEVFTTPLPNGSGGATPQIVGDAGGHPTSIAVSATHVYWTIAFENAVDTGAVVRCPLNGCSGAPEMLANTVGYANGVALDGDVAYWGTTRGTLAKIRL